MCYPVQDGVAETGVSVAFTVKAMDAGPVLAREAMAVDAHMQAPELLEELFARGTRLLLQRLPDVWSGRVSPGSFGIIRMCDVDYVVPAENNQDGAR